MIGIIKGDIRYNYLHMLIENSIISNNLIDFYNIDVLILPFSGIDSDYIIKNTTIDIRDILKNNCIKVIVTGNSNNRLNELCKENNIRIIELFSIYEFVKENAFLTARALLYFEEEELNLYRNSIIIRGYGNIGFYLAKLLKANKIPFKIMPHDKKEEKFALLEDYLVDYDVSKYKLIINTIPANLDIDNNKLNDSLILELASKPYGFDYTNLNNYKILSALPSKYNPYEAAIIIKKHIESFIFN